MTDLTKLTLLSLTHSLLNNSHFYNLVRIPHLQRINLRSSPTHDDYGSDPLVVLTQLTALSHLELTLLVLEPFEPPPRLRCLVLEAELCLNDSEDEVSLQDLVSDLAGHGSDVQLMLCECHQ